MNIKKPLMLAGVASTLTIGGLLTSGMASAATPSGSSDGPMNGLVGAIADKFHLNKSDVQAVVDTQHQKNQQQRAQHLTDELNKLVSDGKLTSAQKDLIVAKQTEVKTFMESLKDKSEADRRSALKTERAQLKSWAQENNIPTQDLRFVLPMRLHGPGGPGPGGQHEQSRPGGQSQQ
ncbi:MAG TPA: hypothetical protein VHB51_02995 [Candidatus Saccharimonadales bacterium]|nr:hypothetical protein [Candidatus Saccharimonadales bacterium]